VKAGPYVYRGDKGPLTGGFNRRLAPYPWAHSRAPLPKQRLHLPERLGRERLVPLFKILDAIIPMVGYVRALTVGGNIYASRVIEFAVALTVFTPFTQKRAGRREVLDAVVVGVGYEYGTVRREPDVGRFVELAVARTGRAPISR
jgi:hypothetical protein